MATITRPMRGKLRVTLPYRPSGQNFRIITEICGPRSNPVWDRQGKYFEVSATYTAKLVRELPNILERPVLVTLYGSKQTFCVSACYNGNPDTRWACVCSCAGLNHGTRLPLSKEIDAELSVEHEWTVSKEWVYPG